jgi:pimeloyl-ACP methyl ester carboxylesterase
MQIVVDKLLTRYDRSGKGKPIVLLHGWADQASGLAVLNSKLIDHYEVIAPDLPGFGGTEMPAEAWGLDDYAAFVEHLLQKVGIIDVYAYIGHSNGGAIAIKGLAGGRFKAKKLILLSSAGIRDLKSKRKAIVKTVARAGRLLTTPLPASVQSRLRRTLYQWIGSDMLAAEHLSSTFKKIVADDVRTAAGQLKLPTLLVYGEDDQTTPPVIARQFHLLIKNSSLKMIPTAGHFVHRDQPAAVIKVVEEFLA